MTTHEEMIQQARDTLFAALPQEMTDQEKALIEDAFQLAKEAHAPQTRDSGLPYILHPLAVALVVVKEMRQKGAAIVAAALLHDVVEDTPHPIEEIRDRFGDACANARQVESFLERNGKKECFIPQLTSLKLCSMFYMRPLLRRGEGLAEWRGAFPEIKGKVLCNKYITFTHKIEYLLNRYCPPGVIRAVYRLRRRRTYS